MNLRTGGSSERIVFGGIHTADAADILTSAYRAIAMDELSQALNLSGSDLTAFIDAHEGWEGTPIHSC